MPKVLWVVVVFRCLIKVQCFSEMEGEITNTVPVGRFLITLLENLMNFSQAIENCLTTHNTSPPHCIHFHSFMGQPWSTFLKT